jgi:hypothetical protein
MRRQIIPCLPPLDARPGSTDMTQTARSGRLAHTEVPFGAGQLPASSGVPARRSVLQV